VVPYKIKNVSYSLQPADQTPVIQYDKYQRRMVSLIFSWWWAHGFPKLVEKVIIKYIEQICAHSWIYLRDYTGMEVNKK